MHYALVRFIYKLTFLIWLISNSNDVTCDTTASEVTTYGRIEICILLSASLYVSKRGAY